MTRLRFTNVTRLRREYKADIELDGLTIGTVTREQSSKMLGYRQGQYRARIDATIVATGETLEELRAELREYFQDEYADARDSW